MAAGSQPATPKGAGKLPPAAARDLCRPARAIPGRPSPPRAGVALKAPATSPGRGGGSAASDLAVHGAAGNRQRHRLATQAGERSPAEARAGARRHPARSERKRGQAAPARQRQAAPWLLLRRSGSTFDSQVLLSGKRRPRRATCSPGLRSPPPNAIAGARDACDCQANAVATRACVLRDRPPGPFAQQPTAASAGSTVASRRHDDGLPDRSRKTGTTIDHA